MAQAVPRIATLSGDYADNRLITASGMSKLA
jgi:hypothetical protein